MLGALRALFIAKPPAAVEATYIALVKAARNSFFYETLKVPDSIDGRFDMIVAHLFLIQFRLLHDGSVAPSREHEAFCRFLSEAFFNDMDCSLREMGVADTGVSHRIRRMGKAYHGRLQAYGQAIGDAQAMRAALARNLYGTVADGDIGALTRMARWVEAMHAELAATDRANLLSGNYVWPDAAAISG